MRSEPLRLLARSVNRDVLVKLKDGKLYQGLLERCDGHMNLVLVKAVEFSEIGGVVMDGRVLIRGSSVLWIRLRV